MLPSIPFSVIPLLWLYFAADMWKCRAAQDFVSSTKNSSDAFCVLPRVPNSVHNLSIADSFKIDKTGETGVALGTVVRYRCNFKYALQGPIDTYECMEDTGRWSSNAFPICEQIMCGAPPSIENGMTHVVYQKSYPIGTRVRYTCEEGYTIASSKAALYCNNKGQWRFAYPTTDWSKPKCIPLSGTNDEEFATPTGVKRNYERNGTISFDYDDGKTEFAVIMFGIAVVAGAIICGFRKGGVCRPITNGTNISSYDYAGDFHLSTGNTTTTTNNNNRRRTTDLYSRHVPTMDIQSTADYTHHPLESMMKSLTPPPRYEEAPPSYEEATRTVSS